MGEIILYLCTGLSSFVMITIPIDFMNRRYIRIHKSSYMYAGVEFVIIIWITEVNLNRNIFWNLLAWILIVAFNSCFFFYGEFEQPIKRILESEGMLFVCIVCELLGTAVVNYFIYTMQIEILIGLKKKYVELFFSTGTVIFIYYMLICRFANIINEKKDLEYEVGLLRNQAKIQRRYYIQQEKKYNQTVRILHDVNKHIKMIEQLYRNEMVGRAAKYTKQIKYMLHPLIPVKYTGNPVLDILLTDKALIIKEKEIEFEIKVNNVNLSFIDSLDVTIIFGNLLDNSIEACETVETEKKIFIDIHSYYEIISIRIENTCTVVKWKKGLPVSEKGIDRGIGLFNVMRCVEKYDGNMKLNSNDGIFTVDIILNS
ncbi:MAG: GHKL domain-containing protein [Lachnospiraceae bacterium]|nr:GHKL domain-containing protein [Lachnospiraceae bacterium]